MRIAAIGNIIIARHAGTNDAAQATRNHNHGRVKERHRSKFAEVGAATRRARRKISAAGRAAISAAQKKRWAAIKRKKATES